MTARAQAGLITGIPFAVVLAFVAGLSWGLTCAG